MVRRAVPLLVCCTVAGLAMGSDGEIQLSVAQGAGGGIELSWTGGSPVYTVYRSADAATVLDPANVIGRSEPGLWVDDPPPGGICYYRITGDDFIVLSVESSLVPAGVATGIRIYTAGLLLPPTSVRLLESGGGSPVSPPFTSDPANPNVIDASLPSGLSAGTWDVEVTADDGRVAVLSGGVVLSEDYQFVVERIEPGVLRAGAGGEVTIDVSPPGNAFEPRVFLAPSGSPGAAVRLQGETGITAVQITALVPPGLAAGVYDVLLVYPDGLVGFLISGLTLTPNPLPRVDSVFPMNLDASSPTTVTLTGDHFAIGGALVTLICELLSGTVSAPGNVLDNTSATEILVELDGTVASAGSACWVEVMNPDGGSGLSDFLTVVTPGGAFSSWTLAADMQEARRWPAAALQRAGGGRRALHAIGGDDGTFSGAKTTVESGWLLGHGAPILWRSQPSLPAPRSAAGVVAVGRFLYLIGGHDGTTAKGSLLRAELLDPEAAPSVSVARLGLGSGGPGFSAGRHIYRVTVVYGASDPSNPLGESLPSRPVPVWVPTEASLEVRLSWDPVAGAMLYRVYRTPLPGQQADQVQLLGETSATSFSDFGNPTTPTLPPADGALSPWHPLSATLNTPRHSHAVAVAADPGAAGTMILYALGGQDAAGVDRSDYEYAAVTLNPDGTQSVGAWTTGTAPLAAARRELVAVSATHALAGNVPDGTTYLYLAGGRQGASVIDTVESTEVGAGGAVAAFQIEPVLTAAHSGAAFFVGSNSNLIVFGGLSGAADDRGRASLISASAPPNLGAWNGIATMMQRARVYAGHAQEGNLLFVLGGADGAGQPLRSVESGVR